MFLSARAGFEPSVPGLAGSPQVPVWGWWGATEGNRGRACVRACVRGSGRAHGAGRQGGAHEARRAGPEEGAHRLLAQAPRARREWFNPAPGSLCSSHAGPRWRRRWRAPACDHKGQGLDGAVAAAEAGAGGPLPSASARPPRPSAPPPPAGPALPNRPTSMVRRPRAPTWGGWS